MKIREFIVIEKKLLPHLPGFAMKGTLLFIPPVDDFLRGIEFDVHRDGHFYVHVFYMPLFVPQKGIHFTHVFFRLRRKNGGVWYADDPNLLEDLLEAIRNDALPYLDSISTLRGVLEFRRSDIMSDWPRVNSHCLEEFAYLLIKNGEYSAALQTFENWKKIRAEDDRPWVLEQRNRAQLIEDKLRQSPEAALAQLEEWKAGTIAKLRLEKYYVPAQKNTD